MIYCLLLNSYLTLVWTDWRNSETLGQRINYDSFNWFNDGGWEELFIVGTAFRIGVFKALKNGPLSLHELAVKIDADKRALKVFLGALSNSDYVIEAEDQFSISTEIKNKLADEDSPDFLGYSVSHSFRLAERWITLPTVVRSGKPFQGDRFSETVKGFVGAMDVYARITAKRVVDICFELNPDIIKMLDIGGALGTVSKLFAQIGIKTTLFDTPDVIEITSKELADLENISFEAGDFNEDLPAGEFDLVYLGNVTHIYGPEKNKILYKRVADRLSAGGMIAILDFVRGISPSAPYFGVNMLVNTESGGTWTVDEYTEWLKAAGFSDIDFHNVDNRDQQLVTAKLA